MAVISHPLANHSALLFLQEKEWGELSSGPGKSKEKSYDYLECSQYPQYSRSRLTKPQMEVRVGEQPMHVPSTGYEL